MSIKPPWNASWTGELPYEIRPCRWANGRMAICQSHRPGVGEPIYASPHTVRQRRAIAEMRCTVCGERTREGDRWSFPLGDWRMIKGRETWVTTEAPVHGECAKLAMAVCPHLRWTGFEPFLFPLTYTVVASFVGGAEVEKDFGIRVQPGAEIIGSLKLSLADDLVREHIEPALRAAKARKRAAEAA